MNSLKIVGYIIMTSKWFESDADENSTFHIIYQDTDTLEYINNDGFRKQWIKAIKPLYGRYCKDKFYISHYDYKTNPRRIHPFAKSVYKWYQRIISCPKTEKIPMLILKKSRMKIMEYWRNFDNHKTHAEELYLLDIYMNHIFFGDYYIKKIQRWYRMRRLHSLIMKEIKEEVAYRPGKIKMLECKESFYKTLRTRINTVFR